MATDVQCLTYSIEEAATILGVSKDVLYRQSRRDDDRRFPAFRLGKTLRVSRQYIDDLLAGAVPSGSL